MKECWNIIKRILPEKKNRIFNLGWRALNKGPNKNIIHTNGLMQARIISEQPKLVLVY